MEFILFAKNTFCQIIARLVTSFVGFLITVIAQKFGVMALVTKALLDMSSLKKRGVRVE